MLAGSKLLKFTASHGARLALAGLFLSGLTLRAAPAWQLFLQEARIAAQKGDLPTAQTKLEAAQHLRPDSPRLLLALAQIYAAAGKPTPALAQLQELAAMGLVMEVDADPGLSRLLATAEAAPLRKAFAANRQPVATANATVALPGCDGIIEGVARDAHGNWYFSDVRNRCLWRRSSAGAVVRFTAPHDDLDGLFGLCVDESQGTLWAATSAVPEMIGDTNRAAHRAGLAEFDLASGTWRRTFFVPSDGRPHVLGDLLRLSDGSILLTDSAAPIVWRLAPQGQKLERWLESDDFSSLQGLAPAPDGHSLIIADYANGLWLVPLDGSAKSLLPPPPHTTLFGIDGLYSVPGGLLAVQNGLNPQRILRIELSGSAQPLSARILCTGRPGMNDFSLGTVVDGHLQFIGDSGWSQSTADHGPSTRTVFLHQL